ncbi:LysR family transcriptional regulator [Paenibacillus pasadenensis]|uniref:LysR family transcriptional regulator n=1 Tax=Paenibacillus pasadenensis TaxID=217090 RepID=UPI0020421EDD|nr:LysR family transcriptional regulator [Paenibacillus pasadenensis]MCM3747354.1 LysR family transcriptional regulator [Paenibacillus pasadenensis]
MELRQLITFRMVALTLNFSRAAAALNYVPSNVSMQIQSLEDELGVKLVDRLNKQIALTEAGKRFYVHVERILNDVEEAKNDLISEKIAGTITISANEIMCTYMLPSVMLRFREQYPDVRLIFRPTTHEGLKQSLYDGVTDVIFIFDEPIASTGLHVEPLREERFSMLAAPNHRLAGQSSIESGDLSGEFFLVHEKGCTYRTMFDRFIIREGADNVTNLEFSSAEAIKQCAMLGMGIAFLPEIAVASELEQGRLIALPLELAELNVAVQMVWHKKKWISPAIHAFLEMARTAMHSPLAGSKNQ